ncbi:MAG: excinuclease ABC subunit UvrC [Desulfosarcina sp.]|nr:excinuclease ABC subunit UvrC [Desulfobacterales bacterium]
MSESTLKSKLGQSPDDSGVYLMKDAGGKVIYVGKAKNLKKRLASYFARADQSDPKTRTLVARIADFETIITATEKEALLLESNLIKRYRPRYNVVLKDDKRYPLIRLDIRHPYPNLRIARKIVADGALYFGPYTSALATRETIKIINKPFKLRKCKNREFTNRTRPCLHHQMGACYGPCCLDVDPDFYREIVNEVVLFLKGRTPDLIKTIRQVMNQASAELAFERAAQLRDKMAALENSLEKQRAVSADRRDRDILSVAIENDLIIVTLLSVRSGYLHACRNFDFTESVSAPAEILSAFIRQYYAQAITPPPEILVQYLPEDRGLLEEWFHSQWRQKVKIHFPQRGDKKRLIEMANQNAVKSLQEKLALKTSREKMLQRLETRLRLSRAPRRIECFDNSNLGGTAAVAGMVVFEDGQANREAYRKFKIQSIDTPDDYGAMFEILSRRFRNHPDWPWPDLLLVDGGKGQLNVALAVIRALGLESQFEVAAIAKKNNRIGEIHDKIYRPNRANPVNLDKDESLLLFLQRIRDEAHRFAIRYHRRRRRKAATESILDDIPGIGPRRRRLLMRTYGSIEKIRAASSEELRALPGMDSRAARNLAAKLRPAKP